MSFTCPECRRVSHHPVDEAEGYCAACARFTAPRGGVIPQPSEAVRNKIQIIALPYYPSSRRSNRLSLATVMIWPPLFALNWVNIWWNWDGWLWLMWRIFMLVADAFFFSVAVRRHLVTIRGLAVSPMPYPIPSLGLAQVLNRIERLRDAHEADDEDEA